MRVCVRCNQVQCRCRKIKARAKPYADPAYRTLRQQYLYAHPFCSVCSMPATEIHHTQKLSLHPETLTDTQTWMSLCKSCHARHFTAKGE